MIPTLFFDTEKIEEKYCEYHSQINNRCIKG